MKKEILVSACLCVEKCRYDARNVENDMNFQHDKVLKIRPEILSRFKIHREPCKIVDGDALDVMKGKVKIIEKMVKTIQNNIY